MMNPDQLRTKFTDYLTPSGWERVRFVRAIKDLNTQMVPLAPQLKGVGREWEPIVNHRSHREGVGPAFVRLKARMRDGVLEMSLDHRSEMYGRGGDMIKQRTTVLTLQNGAIESIQTGRDYCSSNNYKGNKHYIQIFSDEWHSFSPKLEVVESVSHKIIALQNTTNSLRAASSSRRADVSIVY